jgi:hypothetical protein
MVLGILNLCQMQFQEVVLMKTTKALPVIEPQEKSMQPPPTETEDGKCRWPTREERVRKGQEMSKRLEAGDPHFTRAPY